MSKKSLDFVNIPAIQEVPVVTGGQLYSDSTYYYRVFNSTNTFTILNNKINMDLFLLGGGGNGGGVGACCSGGAGAGGLYYVPQLNVNPGTFTVLIGAGGGDRVNGGQGENTEIFGPSLDLIAFGGGKFAGYISQGNNGGSGSGGSSMGSNPGHGVPGQGHDGGPGFPGSYCYTCGAGGGGGAGGPGGSWYSTGYQNSGSGSGGNGTSEFSSWAEITNTGVLEGDGLRYFAGGSGADSFWGNGGAGGLGGGQAGNTNSDAPQYSGSAASGGNGGSGLVIIRYLKSDVQAPQSQTGDIYYNESTNSLSVKTLGGWSSINLYSPPATPRNISVQSVTGPIGQVDYATFDLPINDGNSPILGYNLYIDNMQTTSSFTSNAGDIFGLVPNVTYSIQFTAFNQYGESPKSEAFSYTPPIVVTGGQLYSDATYYYRAFKATDVLYTNSTIPIDALLVGGGGCGRSYYGSGGGAGGVVFSENISVEPGYYPVQVGAGGATGGTFGGSNGDNSEFNFIKAFGGGAGGNNYYGGSSGGSGGGNNGVGILGQGHDGGPWQGGGGGAGDAGIGWLGWNYSRDNSRGGDGINQFASWPPINDLGQSGYIAGGGGGYHYAWGGFGGQGGYGGGGWGSEDCCGSSGVDNTGSGGGSTMYSWRGAGNGASGIVVIRYPRTAVGG
jgi:hypothetical protein